MTVDHSVQFNMNDTSDSSKTEWTGWLNKNPNKWMRGRIMKRNADGHLLYFEELFDRNNTLLASNTIDCGPDPDVAPSTPAYHPPVTPQPPATTSGGFVVAPNDILGAANVQYVNVTIDSVTYRNLPSDA
jgi:hypothetical protein